MIHEKYNSLTLQEKWIFIGKLQHAVMHIEGYYDLASSMIKGAEKEGLFDNVEIMPERKEKSELLQSIGEALKADFI